MPDVIGAGGGRVLVPAKTAVGPAESEIVVVEEG